VRSHGGGRRDGLARTSDLAADGARLLLGLDPVLGEHATQAAVDAFVEQAVDALQALARTGDDGIPNVSGPGRAGPR
jgi:hypothetical protein